MKQILKSALLPCLLIIGGCAIDPWVQPYERANLADEVMKRGIVAQISPRHAARLLKKGL